MNNAKNILKSLAIGLFIGSCLKAIYLLGYCKALRFAEEKIPKSFQDNSVQLANDILRVMRDGFDTEIATKDDNEKLKIIEIWNKVSNEIGPRLEVVIKARKTIEELETNGLE